MTKQTKNNVNYVDKVMWESAYCKHFTVGAEANEKTLSS